MKYLVQLMGGQRFTITEEEFKSFTENPKGMIAFPSCHMIVNSSSISCLFPESLADEVEKRKDQQTGILHDGTRVKRHFGEWVDASGQVPDDRGNYVPIKLDPSYYPEVARDCVPSEKEFYEKYEKLPTAERLALMIGNTEPKRVEGEMKSLKELMK